MQLGDSKHNIFINNNVDKIGNNEKTNDLKHCIIFIC